MRPRSTTARLAPTLVSLLLGCSERALDTEFDGAGDQPWGSSGGSLESAVGGAAIDASGGQQSDGSSNSGGQGTSFGSGGEGTSGGGASGGSSSGGFGVGGSGLVPGAGSSASGGLNQGVTSAGGNPGSGGQPDFGGSGASGTASGGVPSGGRGDSGGAAGTGAAGSGGSPIEASYATLQAVIVGYSCGGSLCHGVRAPRMANLDTMYSGLINGVSQECGNLHYVEPGKPQESALLKILRGPCGNIGRMPDACFENEYENNCVHDEYIDAIEQWILDGAQPE